jgi:hypothetical protein
MRRSKHRLCCGSLAPDRVRRLKHECRHRLGLHCGWIALGQDSSDRKSSEGAEFFAVSQVGVHGGRARSEATGARLVRLAIRPICFPRRGTVSCSCAGVGLYC